jgi:glucose-1-phosphate adenylyltransferase
MSSNIDLCRQTVALVLAGGRGTRLSDLTLNRVKPALYFGGQFRIIDFTLSNCINSGIRRIGVLTQYKSHSLFHHLQRGWSFLRPEIHEFVDLLPAQQRMSDETWYRGTADAVRRNLEIVRNYNARYVVVLAGDHVYKMSYGRMLAEHVEHGADLTVATVDVSLEDATSFGVLATDDTGRVVRFSEKPPNPEAMPGRPDRALASMGIYVFNAEFLYRALERDAIDADSNHDFGNDVIPRAVREDKVYAHDFEKSCVKSNPDAQTYWRDVGTVDAYWSANLDLVEPTPILDVYDPDWSIATYHEQLPPSKFLFNRADRRGMAIDSVVANGSIVSGATVYHSVLSPRCHVHSFSEVSDSVLLPAVDVGRRARLHKCVVDRGVKIPEGMVAGYDPAEDAERFSRSPHGVTVITQAMVDRLNPVS